MDPEFYINKMRGKSRCLDAFSDWPQRLMARPKQENQGAE
jgi:hypothetical protein